MRTLFFTGRNPVNKGGLSSKIWRIRRDGRTVTTWWGAVNILNGKIVGRGTLQSKSRSFKSAEAAIAHERGRIRNKEQKGYAVKPRRRA